MKTRVVLADDHKVFREALRNLLAREADIEVVGAGDANAVLELARSVAPNVIVIDLRSPSAKRLAELRQLVTALPSVKVIVLSVTADSNFAAETIAAGASAYLTKADAEELPQAIRAVANGTAYLSISVRK